jgi:hypothetical protein
MKDSASLRVFMSANARATPAKVAVLSRLGTEYDWDSLVRMRAAYLDLAGDSGSR